MAKPTKPEPQSVPQQTQAGIMSQAFHAISEPLEVKKLSAGVVAELFLNQKQVTFTLAGKVEKCTPKVTEFGDCIVFKGEFAANIEQDGKKVILISSRCYLPKSFEEEVHEEFKTKDGCTFTAQITWVDDSKNKKNARGYIWNVSKPKVAGQKSFALQLLETPDSQLPLALPQT